MAIIEPAERSASVAGPARLPAGRCTEGAMRRIVANDPLGKLAMRRILHDDARVMTRSLGAASMLDGPDKSRGADANRRAAFPCRRSRAVRG